MQSSSGWWRRNIWTLAILLGAFAAAFLVRTTWTWPVVQQYGALYTYAGGSDSFYHSRVTTYIILTHHNLIKDAMLKFPFGAINPREPLFDWMNAILGIVFAPFFGGNAVNAGAWFLELQGPLWAALSVFPVYLIGKEVFSKRTGLIAAVIFPFLPASIDSSIFGYANYLSFYTFLILIVLYSWIRTVKAVSKGRYVGSYRDPKQIYQGLRTFLRTERTAVKWSVFTGVSLGALALAWQGYTYAVVVIALSVLILLIAERIRHIDSFGLYVCAWIVGLVGFPMAIPYYLAQNQFAIWFGLPLLLFFGVLALLLPFLMLRDFPWVVSIPALVGLVIAAAVVLAVVSPDYFTSIVTGQGYFVKTLIYSTVAEAQAPSIDELVVGYGVITFFLAFVGVALAIVQMIRRRFPRVLAVFLVFAILSIYLPISAAKFFLLGSPAFALLPAEALRQALDIAGFPELRRTVASLSDRRSQLSAFRRAFKLRHVLIFALVLGLILPNIWISIDAGIPGNTKSGYSVQVANSLPSWLQPNPAIGAGNAYFGAAGTSLDTPNQYDSAGYNWLATQDTNTPAPNRPAVVSWWDYGFQTIDQGAHPSVADNFQNGIDPAGQFLLAQNESNAIGVLATTLLQAVIVKNGSIPSALNTALASEGLNVTKLHSLLVNESADYNLVVANPNLYLPVDPKTLTDDNAMYLAVSNFIGSSLPLSGVANMYNNLQAYTGWSIRYDLVDSRLVPFSGQDTGIFYAPADLTGRVINTAGLPADFFNVTVLGSNGNTYPLGGVPASVSAVQYNINYFQPFYNSMIYHTYFGYDGAEIGQSSGIPGLSSNLQNSAVQPGWMLQHFEVVYRTAYYCATQADNNNSNCNAENLPAAVAQAKATPGSVANTTNFRYFQGGEAMLEYYPGQTVVGTAHLADGTSASGVRVTAFDQWGIPHMTTVTAADGSYSLILPPGNDTLNFTAGAVVGLEQQGSVSLKSVKIYVPNSYGFGFNPPTLTLPVQLRSSQFSGTIYWNTANNTTYVPTRDVLISGAQVVLWGSAGQTKVIATTDRDGTFDLTNVAPGVYNYSVLYAGHNYSQPTEYLNPGTAQNGSVGLSPATLTGQVLLEGTPVGGTLVTASDGNGTIGSYTTNSSGNYTISGLGPGNYTLVASGPLPFDRSAGIAVQVTAPATKISTNLTVEPTATVQFVLEANGATVPNIPVRFVPLPSFSNASQSPLASLAASTSNATVVVANAAGIATATLPVGNYSVYALGYVGGSLVSALTSVSAFPGLPSALTPLPLETTALLSGSVAQTGPSTNSSQTAVLAYGSGFDEVTTWAASDGSYSLLLPLGNYTVLALKGSTTGTTGLTAALAQVALRYPTVLPLRPVPAVATRFAVGSLLSDGGLFPAVAATVSISAGPSGPSIPTLASSNGTVAFYLPSSTPLSAGGYCITAQSAGFLSTSECGYTANGLASLSRLPLTLRLVNVQLEVTGLPAGTSVAVNFTSLGVPATTHTFSGVPEFTFTTTPGPYTISARAVIGKGTVIYLPSSLLNTTIPLGAYASNLTLHLVPGINSTGTLQLPSGGAVANVTVALTSSLFNVTVNGTNYTHGFYVAPGTYSAHSTLTVAGVTYTTVSRVTVSAGGTITPTLSLRSAGVSVTGTFLTSLGGQVPINTTLTLTASDGASLQAPVENGTFTTTLPANSTFAASADGTVLTSGPNGSFVITYTTSPGALCVTTSNATNCPIELVPQTNLVWLNGTLAAVGVPGLQAGTIRLAGPYPATTVTLLNTTNGTFSTQLLPGAYSLYATGGGSSDPLANLTTVVALRNSAPVAVSLGPTWSATLSVGGPNGSSATLGRATVVVQNVFGTQVVYTGVTVGVPFAVALPLGTYRVSASTMGAPYGVATNASGSAILTVTAGNVALTIPLSYTFSYRATGTLIGSPEQTLNAGGKVSYQFTVRNSGDVPITVHPVGSPSYWTFNFSFANATLAPGPSGSTLTAEVTIHVPAGTVVLHPPVLIELALANGTIVGSVAPAPALNINGYYGVAIGVIPSSAPTLSTAKALLPFYLVDTGNVYEDVHLTIVDQARINSLGWTVNIRAQNATLAGPVGLSPGVNSTAEVNLSARESVYVPVGTVTLSAIVTNSSGAVADSLTLHVPVGSISPGSTNVSAPFTVTGPGVGIPPATLPGWVIPLVVFVPAIGLAVALLVRRWAKTRRWTRR
ncbi:MAG: carboxypeptidase regulatory-like domain-containing protein [Thermoplasmata archaeon]